MILGAAYMLYLYRRVVFGKLLRKEDLKTIKDLNMREVAVFAPLVVAGALDGDLSQSPSWIRWRSRFRKWSTDYQTALAAGGPGLIEAVAGTSAQA